MIGCNCEANKISRCNFIWNTTIILIYITLFITACGVDGGGGGSSTQQGNSKSATLSWEAPTTNVDGTPITDLSGYKVYYGKASHEYSVIEDVGLTENPGAPEHSVINLEKGARYYFAVTAYDTSGNESNYSEEVYKDIQ